MLLDHGRETVGTTALDGEPDVILRMPGDSYLPFLCTVAMTVLVFGGLYHLWWLTGAATLLVLVISIAWLWPRSTLVQTAGGVHG
jgi:cytochrome c oxidase subunit 1/cytochrome c oxidase subunit I+III